MFCIKCGTSLPDDANFCFKCGCDLRNLSQSAGTEFSAVKVGDYVKFGSYPQNNGDIKEPIEWLVLEVNGKKALLISRYGIDCKKYHYEFEFITWENCDLRKWLNGEFFRNAFTVAEQKKIAVTNLANDNNAKYGTFGGNSTEDWVFCLSFAETMSLFKDNVARKSVPTLYAVGKGAWQNSSELKDGRACCFWWLRSSGINQHFASYVDVDGTIYLRGCPFHSRFVAVRPALWVNL